MYEFDRKFYERLAGAIVADLDNIYYFSGSETLACDDGTECRFTASLLIYRRAIADRLADTDDIEDVVPVWWECRTFAATGEEVLNDFDFALLREAMAAL